MIDSASLKCRHLFRDSCDVKSAGLEVDILSLVFISALCKIMLLFVVSVTLMLMQHHVTVSATALSSCESSTLHCVTHAVNEV